MGSCVQWDQGRRDKNAVYINRFLLLRLWGLERRVGFNKRIKVSYAGDPAYSSLIFSCFKNFIKEGSSSATSLISFSVLSNAGPFCAAA